MLAKHGLIIRVGKLETALNNHEPRYAKYLSRIVRPFPNFDFFFIKSVREFAVNALLLRPGAAVLDLGCGSGASFPYLLQAVGVKGSVVGIDVSPQSCINARRRIASNNWQNVEVIQAPAETAEPEGSFEGALMFAAPDVFAVEPALDNILPHLNRGAHIAIFGAKLSHHPIGRIFNPILRFLTINLSAQSPVPDEMPWQQLSKHLDKLEIREYAMGTMFVAHGKLRG